MKFKKTLTAVFVAAAGVIGCASPGERLRAKQMDHLEEFDRQEFAKRGFTVVAKTGTGTLDEKTMQLKPPRYQEFKTDVCYTLKKTADDGSRYIGCVMHDGVNEDTKVVGPKIR